MSDREFGGMFTPHLPITHSTPPQTLPTTPARTTTLSFKHGSRSNAPLTGNDDLSLPKATVQKIINEILSHDAGVSFARETRDLLIECCVEFITLISSEANEIAEKEAKKTIACEHVTSALEQLGYADYVPEIVKVAQEHKTQQVVSFYSLKLGYSRFWSCIEIGDVFWRLRAASRHRST